MTTISKQRAATFIVVSVMTMLLTYFYEKSKPASDYYEYYGNVTTDTEFHFPEKLSAYTFGVSHIGDTLEMDFINQLFCTPIGSTLGPQLVATRYKHFDSFSFANKLPHEISEQLDAHGTISRIGEYEADKLRDGNYYSWHMDDIRPYADSECYITAEATGYSAIFRLPKATKFNGNTFTYSTKLRDSGKPYAEWYGEYRRKLNHLSSVGKTETIIELEE